ncbi:MAG: replicative DNA helicase [Alphaproteobacteria bacterium]|nr:replicative DNA helicase [Alphaproteobacteria bacterium]
METPDETPEVLAQTTEESSSPNKEKGAPTRASSDGIADPLAPPGMPDTAGMDEASVRDVPAHEAAAGFGPYEQYEQYGQYDHATTPPGAAPPPNDHSTQAEQPGQPGQSGQSAKQIGAASPPDGSGDSEGIDDIVVDLRPDRLRVENHALEAALLGGLMLDNKRFEDLPTVFPSSVFTVPLNATIFDTMHKLYQRRHVAQPATLAPYLADKAGYKEAGGAAYLNQLVASVISLGKVGKFAENLVDLHLKRELVRLGDQIGDAALDPENTGEDLIDQAEQSLYQLSVASDLESKIKDFAETMDETLAHLQEIADGVIAAETGYDHLDQLLGGGMQPTDLIVLAGRPGAGKTAFSVNLAQAIAQNCLDQGNGKYVLYFSLEMPATQLGMRVLASKTGIDSKTLKEKITDPQVAPRIIQAASKLSSLPLLIDDTPVQDVITLRRNIRRAATQFGPLATIFVDYLQLIRSPSNKRTDSRVYEIADITRALKGFAREYKVPIVMMAQLSREVEKRSNSEPVLSDLRDSGAIEQDADLVMFIYRTDQAIMRRINELQSIDPNDVRLDDLRAQLNDATNKAVLKVAKHRNGPLGSIGLIFEEHLTRFSENSEQPNLDRMRQPSPLSGVPPRSTAPDARTARASTDTFEVNDQDSSPF